MSEEHWWVKPPQSSFKLFFVSIISVSHVKLQWEVDVQRPSHFGVMMSVWSFLLRRLCCIAGGKLSGMCLIKVAGWTISMEWCREYSLCNMFLTKGNFMSRWIVVLFIVKTKNYLSLFQKIVSCVVSTRYIFCSFIQLLK